LTGKETKDFQVQKTKLEKKGNKKGKASEKRGGLFCVGKEGEIWGRKTEGQRPRQKTGSMGGGTHVLKRKKKAAGLPRTGGAKQNRGGRGLEGEKSLRGREDGEGNLGKEWGVQFMTKPKEQEKKRGARG